jgi:hypothetical protein
MRWKAKINKRKLAGEIVDIPGDFVDLPRFYDHSFLHHLNERAKKCGLPPVFDDVHLVGKNNGEVYLSKYFEQQMVRNQTVGQDKKTSMCQCQTCTTYLSKNTEQQATLLAPPEDKNKDDDEGNEKNEGRNDVNLLNLPAVPPFLMQPAVATTFLMPPPPSTSFVPPIPLVYYAAGGWMPRPQDCCYMVGDYHCTTYAGYLRQKNCGMRVLGKPPHHLTCPVRNRRF